MVTETIQVQLAKGSQFNVIRSISLEFVCRGAIFGGSPLWRFNLASWYNHLPTHPPSPGGFAVLYTLRGWCGCTGLDATKNEMVERLNYSARMTRAAHKLICHIHPLVMHPRGTIRLSEACVGRVSFIVVYSRRMWGGRDYLSVIEIINFEWGWGISKGTTSKAIIY